MSKFVLDGVTFDLENAIVTNDNGAWIVNTKPAQVQKPEYELKRAKKKSERLDSLHIPTLNTKYESNIIEKFHYGSVSNQIFNKFKTVNVVDTVSAHTKQSVYSAFNVKGWGVKFLETVDENTWKVARTR